MKNSIFYFLFLVAVFQLSVTCKVNFDSKERKCTELLYWCKRKVSLSILLADRSLMVVVIYMIKDDFFFSS